MEKLKIDDFKKYHFLSQLKYSPDGAASAIIATKANDKNGYCTSLFVQKGGNGFSRLTSPFGKVDTFIWLDNETILFSEIRCPDRKKAVENGEELTTFNKISIHGGEAEEAFTIDMKVKEIHKIDDKRFLINTSFNNSRPDLTGKAPHEKQQILDDLKKEKAYQIIDELPFWFNGAGFTNKIRSRLYIYDIDSGLTPVTGPLTRMMDYKLAPCGNYVAYTGQEFEDVADIKSSIYLYSIETGDTKTILGPEYMVGSIAIWGKKLIFMASKGEKHGNNQNKDFYIADLETGEYKLLHESFLSIGSPVNSDCRLGGGHVFKVYEDALYFTRLDGFYAEICKMNLADGSVSPVTDAKGSVDFFDISSRGIQAVILKDGKLQEVYEVNDSGCNQISSFNEEIHKNYIYQHPEYHTFVNPHGTEIDGWAILPVGYEKGKKYPGILTIHGGPKTAFGDIYFHEMQYWAAEGYFVLFCNPTGSDGRGNEFADIRGKYGTVDYEDLMQFVDVMLERYPDIDADKLGVTGGSYGGFMTNWIIGHTDRFKAAASQRSIANWIGFTYICDIGYHFGTDQMQADAWSNVDKLWEHSPLKYADKATTPTLFIHSDQDYRCWVPEALQMYTALKLHNVDSRICLFHGENHELSRSGKPDNRVKRLSEITQWMDQYLK